MATTKKNANVDIKPIELATVELTIVGTTPLIVHAWSHKAKQEMLDKQMGKSKKAKHDIKVPVNDFMAACYWLTEQPEPGENDEDAERIWLDAIESGARFGFPVTGIKQSAIMGAKRGGLDVVATELRGSFYLEGATDASTTDLAEIVGSVPAMREDMVKVGGMSKTADIRHRPQWDTWEIPLKMTYNVNGKYSLEQLLNCFNVGGFVCGIGEWRPERDGQMGMYHVKWRGRHGGAWTGLVVRGAVWWGMSWQGVARRDEVRQARQGLTWRSEAWQGRDWFGRRGWERCDLARRCMAMSGEARPGEARLGEERQAWLGMARCGMARPGRARCGTARPTCKTSRRKKEAMTVYRWKTGSRMSGSAQTAGEVCQRLEERGELTQARLVDESRPEDAPLHGMFEWDDTVAAERFREVQAGKIIRSLEVHIEAAEPSVTRAYVSISVDESPREYVGIVRAMSDEDKRRALLKTARDELRAFRAKYKGLSELSKVFEAIEEVL